MLKFFTTILCFYASAASATTAKRSYNNPWFTWKSISQAERQFDLSNTALNNRQCIFSNRANKVVFNNGSRIAELDGIRFWLNVAPETAGSDKNWRLSAIDLDLLSLTIQTEPAGEPKKLTVMIDAGHGGKDPGAISTCGSLKEKDIVLDMALKTGKLLKKAGLKVLYTRTKDKTLSLTERSAAAYKEKADLFLSIHANKASNTNASGFETFVLTPSGYAGTASGSPPRGWQIGNKNDYNSNLLGYTLQKQLIEKSDSVDRGLKRQSFFVLRETYCPAALVEIGFLSNPADIGKMKTVKWRSGCAAKLCEGVLEYCRRVDSLEKTVAAKRKRESDANERWREYLTAKKNKQTEAELNRPTVRTNQKTLQKSETAETVKLADNPETPDAQVSSSTHAKLDRMTKNSVQSVATNIYLSSDSTEPDVKQNRQHELESLMEFYE
ncbi:MAG: N-acetylmuramoyl-L-alanine amidase [Kiritimatiellia bacterium]